MDFDTWAQLGNRGWGYADVLPYFRRMERRLGDGDETYPRPRRQPDGLRTRLAPSAVRGLHRGRDHARHPAQPRLQRRHPGRRRLRPAHHREGPPRQRRTRVPASRRCERPNLDVRTHAHTTEILASKASARVGVTLSRGRTRRRAEEVRAGREVILSGGAVQLAAAAAALGHRPARSCCNRSASPCGTRSPASARTCATTTRRASRVRVKNIDTINETRARPAACAAEVAKLDVSTRKGILAAQPDARLLLLALRARHRQLRPAVHLHAGELPGGRAGPARARARHDGRLLAAAPREPRLRARCAPPIRSSTHHPAQLSRRGERPPRAARRHEARAPPAQDQAARALLRLRGFPGRQGADRRRAARGRQAARHHHVPPGRHLPHGAGAPTRWPWSTTSCACTGSKACA